MRNIRILIEYDGTNYHGWQVQPNAVSIQETIQDRLRTITQEDVRVIASGRTDAGVHAVGQVAHFHTDSRLHLNDIQRGLNGLLPADIAVKRICEVDKDFHARYSAKNKKYRYVIFNDRFPSPLCRNFSWHIPFKLDVDEMKKALQCLIGRHDFSSFKASGCNSRTSIREVLSVSLGKNPRGFVIFEIEANAFLKQMVRNIVGTMVDVGQGKSRASLFEEIFQSGDRKRAGRTAPPQGLFLVKVEY